MAIVVGSCSCGCGGLVVALAVDCSFVMWWLLLKWLLVVMVVMIIMVMVIVR